MRAGKPQGISDAMWSHFNEVCDANGIGDCIDDWEDWWKLYWAGYEFRCM